MAERNFMEVLREDAPEVAEALIDLAGKVFARPALPEKTKQLIYLAVCAAVHHDRGVAVHCGRARALGATREEVIEALLLTIPAAGLSGVSRHLAAAVESFD
jgi:AhpD family alkylhydroperoxidase